MAAYKDTLRSLALNDEQFVDSVLGMGHDTVEASGLDPKTHALLRLGGLAGSRRGAELLPVDRGDGAGGGRHR